MKKSVKLIALLMAVTMIISSMFTCLVASAADPVGTITVGTNDQVKVGDTTATVDITIDFTNAITAPHDLFTLTAPTGFTLTAAEVKEVVYTTLPKGSAGVTIDAEDGADLAAGKILLESPVDTKAPVVEKIVVTATYAIAETVVAGTHTITVDSEIADITESDLTLEEVNGAIVVAEAHTCAPAGEPKIENEVAATCYAEGSYDSVVYCSCGKELSRDTLPVAKIAHTPAEAVPENNVPATCYKEGSYDSVVYCSVEACKAEISRTTVPVPVTDHTPAEATVENNVDPTCYAKGSYDSVVYCSVEECKHEISRTTVPVEKIAHTPAAPVEENRVEPKPGVAGSYDSVVYCSVEACKAEISRTTNEIPALPEEPVKLNINGINRMKSLALKDVIYINPFVAFVEVKDGKNYNATAIDKAYIVENGKILFWDTNPGENAVIGTETAISSIEYDSDYKDTSDAEKIHEYKGKSMGIPAKNFGDTIYYRTYIVVDGKEYYGDIIEYSVQTYCYNQINSTKTTESQNKLRALCATMLNFGSSAQVQLKYKTDNLSNSILPSLVENGKLDAKYLEQNWNDSLLVPANTPSNEMIVNFVQDNAQITEKTLQLKGAIEPKITMGYKIVSNKATKLPDDADLTFYFWNATDYEKLVAAGTPLTKENASYTKTLGETDENGANEVELAYSSSYGYEYWAKPDAIPARQLEQTFYFVAIVTEADGKEYCTGVNSYSPIQYAINQINKPSAADSLKDLCRWIALYWDAAKTYLG